MHVKEMFDLSGKSALVTGGSRGLGLDMAAGLGEAGARVHITARREQWLTPALQHLLSAGIDASASTCDVSNEEEVDDLATELAKRFGAVDILVNNAGVSWGTPLEELSLDRWRYVIDVNLTGTFLVTRAIGRGMIEAGRGKVINISSVAGQLGVDAAIMNASVYHASKGGIDALTRDLAIKWARHGIYVNAIAPGYFPTRMTEGVIAQAENRMHSLSPFGRIGAEGELKGVVVFLASAASNWITGQVIAVDGGYTAW
jgi:NAD(P)-dependent dehydrogenase (short-subunit alcohol dehydrogenase family)